ncbi:MAG: hypothetical protein ACRC0J_04305 [Shewanella oncorhynchi]
MLKKIIVTMMIVWASTVAASPSIQIGAMTEIMDSGKSTIVKRVHNVGNSTAYVKISLLEIVYDEHGDVKENVVSASLINNDDFEGLVASPARLIVRPDSVQTTRLLFMGSREKERYYRVRFEPVLPESNDLFNLDNKEVEQYNAETKKNVTVGVQVLTGYGAVLIIRPEHAQYDTQIEDVASNYKVQNAGNSIVIMDMFYDCKAGLTDCGTPQKFYLRPGISRSFNKAPGRSYKFKLFEGSNERSFQFGEVRQ